MAGDGLERVTMRQVAAEAGVSTRLLQYYFGTREALLAGAYASRSCFDRERLKALIPAGRSWRRSEPSCWRYSRSMTRRV